MTLRARHRWTAWLAAFALGLLLVAPAISRCLATAAHHHPGVAAQLRHKGHAASPHHPADPLDACSYCTMLASQPVVAVSWLHLPSTPPGRTWAVSPLRSRPAAHPRPPNTEPRGPPSTPLA